jgi:hypothetical protein
MSKLSRRRRLSPAVPLASSLVAMITSAVWAPSALAAPGNGNAAGASDSSTTAEPAAAEASSTSVEQPVAPAVSKSRGIPLHVEAAGWGISLYGFAELDGIYDTTRSFGEGANNNSLARPNTFAGDNPQTQFTIRNSRIGFDLKAPDVGAVKTSGVIEWDFFGTQSSSTQNDLYTNAIPRLRMFYVKVQDPIVDVLAGQYHDLYGWGGAGFFANSVAFLPLLGEIYHRNPQLRLSKVFGGDAVSLELAVAAVRPVQTSSVMPDGQAGIKFNVNGFRGAATPGASRPVSAPFGVGISAVGRRLSVTDFAQIPGNEHTVFAGGVAGNLFLPIIPAHGPDKEDLSNALSLTVEGSMGTGVADLYPGLTGGVMFPSLPNPQLLLPVPVYTPNVDPGIATYDTNNVLQTINWSSVVANLHYHFPFDGGRRLWVSFTGALIQSNNAVELTPLEGQSAVWNKGAYADGNLWISVTSPLLVGLSVQAETQTFGDGVMAHNYRGEASCYFYF